MLRLSTGGKAVRVRFTNAFGAAPLAIGGARIALLDAKGLEIAGSSRLLTFDGHAAGIAAKGAPLLTDVVKMNVPALARVAVSLFLPGETGPCTCHFLGLDDTEVSAPGNFLAAPFKPEKVIQSRAFLAAVEVDAPAGSGTVVAIGDSITDGAGATNKANTRWPDRLAERLAARGGRTWGVANQGISGNRLLHDQIGESVLSRFDRDVLAITGVKSVIVFIGINDIGLAMGGRDGPGSVARTMNIVGGLDITAEQMIAGYRQLIARAHSRNVKIYGATIAPYKGAAYWTERGEAARQKVNAFIRSGAFDGVVDFDKSVGSPADPLKFREGYHGGDHLHGNDAGYKAMADSIDLNLFPR
jgi:lysophospholipase L1-like esterase